MTASPMGRRSVHTPLAAFAAALAALALPAAALADTPPKPSSSGIAQYVEMLPTSTGEHAPGVGKITTTPLAPESAKRLSTTGGAAAATLAVIATSSNLGAPTKKLTVDQPTEAKPEIKRLLHPATAPKPKVLASSVGAVATGSGGARGIVLLVLAIATAVAIAAAAARRSA